MSTCKVWLKPSVCKWMLDNQDIYMAGPRYEQNIADIEVPLFMLGVLLDGLPGVVGPKNDVNCYKFTTTVKGLKNFYLYVERKDFYKLG